MKTYRETITYLYSQLPVYQRVGGKAFKASLKNSLALDSYFSRPHSKFKSIHIAGTNGKGSTASMIASVLQAAGYRVGVYSSPHLTDFRERIQVNERMVGKNYVTGFVRKHRAYFETLHPSFFEITVAMAFAYFAYKKVDVAVVEVGLGGRIDSTNILRPVLSVITNIGMEHTNFLGDTLPLIAQEKAGIIKKEVPVVIGESQAETREIFKDYAKKNLSSILFADEIYALESSYKKESLTVWKQKRVFLKDLYVNLKGLYQQNNLLTAIATLEQVRKTDFPFNKNCYHTGFSQVSLKGRWQVLKKNPLVVADIAHNYMGLALLFKQVKLINYYRLYIIFGLSDGKDIGKIMPLLPKNAQYQFVQAKNIKRGISTETLAAQARLHKLRFSIACSTQKALDTALHRATNNDMILITGSTFIVAEIV